MAYLNVSESSLKFEIIINKSNSRAYSYWLGINAAYLSNLEKTRNFETGSFRELTGDYVSMNESS